MKGAKTIVPKFEKTLFITGLRGWAAFGVFLSHFGLFYDFKNEYIYRLTAFGHNGVVLFFIISSFTIAYSLDRSKNFNFRNYLKKRYFRIAPLLYIVSIYGFLFATSPWRYPNYPRFDIPNLIAHFAFLNLGELNFDFQNSLIGVEWTLPIEFFFYLILPFLFIKSKNGLFIFLLLLGSLFLHLRPDIYNSYKSPHNVVGFHWSLQKYFFVFMLGIFTYNSLYIKNFYGTVKKSSKRFVTILICTVALFLLIISHVTPQERIYFSLFFILYLFAIYVKPKILGFINNRTKWLAASVDIILLFAIFLVFGGTKPIHESLFVALAGHLLIVSSHTSNLLTRSLLENKFVIFLGTISYSFYLLQLPIHDILFKKLHLGGNTTFYWVLIFVSLIIASTATYNLIEKRFIAYAHRKTK